MEYTYMYILTLLVLSNIIVLELCDGASVSKDGANVEGDEVPLPSSYTGTRYSGFKAGIPRYSGLQRAIASGVTVRGVDRYVSRFSNDEYFDEDPPICYSEEKVKETFPNRTFIMVKMGYFVCPYENSDTLEDRYCCGDPRGERCCGYWDGSGRKAGTIIGIAVAVLFVVVSFGMIFFKCYRALQT